jgi:hypothetical protein
MTNAADAQRRLRESGAPFMSISTSKRALVAAMTTIALLSATSLARADINDYEFQLVEKDIKKGEVVLSIRLVHKSDGKAVADAVIFATRLDMAPEGMEMMATQIAPLPGGEPGVYRFKANLTMQGGWQLSLGAKIQGETGTLENKLVLKALP